MKKFVCLGLLFMVNSLYSSEVNLIKNGDFESSESSGWKKSFIVDPATAHSGRNALKVEAPNKSVFRIKNISKGKRYKVSGWVKCGDAKKAEIRLIRRIKKGRGYEYLGGEVMVGSVNGSKDWTYVEHIFENLDADCFDVWLWLPVQKNGVAWFDDLVCEETKNIIDRNILRNSSFTLCSNPGIPDFWGIPIEIPFAYKDWGKDPGYGVDPAVKSPVPGTNSLRLKRALPISTFLLSAGYLNLPKGTYTISVYMKSEKQGTEVEIWGGFGNKKARKKIALTKDWKRYSHTMELAGGARTVFFLRDNGTIWFAAPQVVEGTEPGKYSISLFDISHAKKRSGRAKQAFRNSSVLSSFTAHPPKVDGVLNDECWKSAGQLNNFIRTDGESPSVDTLGLITSDKKCLYIALRCEIPKSGYPSKGKPVVFAEDTVELFLGPSPDGKKYYHFAGGKSGGKYCAIGKNAAWETDWNFKTSQTEKEWTAEIAIPYKCLIDSQPKLPWKINLGRSIPLKLENEYSCWSHSQGFHNPDKFGILSGIKPEIKKTVKTTRKNDGLLLSAMLEYPYYMEEENAEVKIILKKGEPCFLDFVAVKRDNEKNYSLAAAELGKNQDSVKVFSIPISPLPVGTYNLIIRAKSAKGNVSEIKEELIKLPPRQIDVRINKFTRSLSSGNKPYLATVFHPPRGNIFLKEWQFEELRNHKFNTIIASTRICNTEKDFQVMNEAINKCINNDFKIILWITHAWKGKNDWDSFKDELVRTIRRFKNIPGIIAWYILDEPSPHQYKKMGLGEKNIIQLYQVLKKEDPYRPIIVNWTKNQVNVGREPFGTLSCCDLPTMDCYPFNYVMVNRMVRYSGYAELFNKMVAPQGKPTMFWVQNYGYNDSMREPKPGELKCMDFLDLVFGTRLLAYYTGRPMSNELWRATQKIHEQLFKVADTVIFTPDSRYLRSGVAKSISYSVWEKGEHLFILAVNQLSENTELLLDLNSISEKPLTKVVGELETNSPGIIKNVLSDSLKPMQCQLYKLK